MLLCIISRKSKSGLNFSCRSILSTSNLVQDLTTTQKHCSLHFLKFPKGCCYLSTVNPCLWYAIVQVYKTSNTSSIFFQNSHSTTAVLNFTLERPTAVNITTHFFTLAESLCKKCLSKVFIIYIKYFCLY